MDPALRHLIDQDPRAAAQLDALVAAARDFGALGWTPATSGNYSVRMAPDRMAVTRSGVHKRDLKPGDMLLADLSGAVIGEGKSSAETGLHAQLYRGHADIGAVLHVHSPTTTVASRRFAAAGRIELAGYELLKAFAGLTTHATTLTVPVLANDQDIDALAASAQPWLNELPMPWCYLIEGHGAYAWGRDVAEASRHLEALDFLLACHLIETKESLS